jgi:hypothetical protein
LREAGGLDWLPDLGPELAGQVRTEEGRFFFRARREADHLPASLAALTQWQCGE